MIQMKKYIYLLTIAALAAFGCTPEGPVEDANKEYAGNKAKVTLEDVIPATGGVAQAIVKSEVPFTVSVPKAATWLTVDEITDIEVEEDVETVVDGVPVLDVVMSPRKVITFVAGVNNSAEKRFASVALVDSEKNIVITRFDVTQEGNYVPVEKKEFGVSTNEINVEADATTATFKVTGEVAWTVTSSNEAFVVSPASGEGEADVTVTFPANETAEAVVAEITVATEDPGAKPKAQTVVITQASAVKVFVATMQKTTLEQYEQISMITIESDVDWVLTSSNSGVVFPDSSTDAKVSTQLSGKGNMEVEILVPANFTYEDVKSTITVTTEDPLVQQNTYTFDFTQKAYTIPTGQVLAEWYFAKSETNTLKAHYDLAAKSGGNSEKEGFGYPDELYIDANSQGTGKFKYWQVDKEPIVDAIAKRCKRQITSAGEPMAVPPYTGDYALWTATSASPLAAGTKVHIFFAVRPADPEITKYWKLQYLDGGEWKPVAEQIKTATTANGTIEYTHELVWTGDRQTNTFVDAVVTLTAETSEVQFKFECVDNTQCDGGAWGTGSQCAGGKVAGALELRFAGWDSTGSANPQYCVLKRPVIEVIQ